MMGGRDCFKESLRIVSLRPYSVLEVRGKLLQKGFDQDLVEKSIGKLREYGYLDDRELARTLIRFKFNSAGYGRRKISEYLRRRKIPEDIINSELTKTVTRDRSVERGVELLVRKQERGKRDILDERQRVFRFLAGRGFDPGECVDIISVYEEKVRAENDGEGS
jgi:regulatory protein